MTVVSDLPLPTGTLPEPSPGTLRITLSNADQGEHLHNALRGHCDAEVVGGSDRRAIWVVVADETQRRSVLRRVDAWLSEFGVASATLEFDGRVYKLAKS